MIKRWLQLRVEAHTDIYLMNHFKSIDDPDLRKHFKSVKQYNLFCSRLYQFLLGFF